MSEDHTKAATATDTDETGWDTLRPAVNYDETHNSNNTAVGATTQKNTARNGGAFGRIRAEAPAIAAEPDIATGAVPVVAARSKLAQSGIGSRVRTYTSVSTGFIPLVREVHEAPKNPTLSALARDAQTAEETETADTGTEAAEEPQHTDTARAHLKEYRTETTTSNKIVRAPLEDPEADPIVRKIEEQHPESRPVSGSNTPVAHPRAKHPADRVQLDKPHLLRLRTSIIALAVPVVTLMLAIRLIASDIFLWLEYHRPGFPADSYGFDTAERLRIGSYGISYVTNITQPSYLESITTGPNGKPAFLPSEVAHMQDVKFVILSGTVAAIVVLALALICSAGLRLRAPGTVRRSIFAGAWLTVIMLAVFAAVGIFSWEWLFTTFHTTFFPQGNWQFHLNDTLIRLYPPQFWVDAAIAVVALSVLIALLLFACTWPTRYRKQVDAIHRAERIEMLKKLKKVSATGVKAPKGNK